MSFWDVIWFIFISYVFVAYLMVIFSVIGDIFRNELTGGFGKAIWILALIFVPVLTLLIYLIANGSGMAERSMRQTYARQSQQEAYIKEVAGTNVSVATATPGDQVMQAKALLDAGAISSSEYDALKAKALV